MFKKALLSTGLLLSLGSAYAEELSQEQIAAYIKYREAVMESASANMSAAGQLISGKVALGDRLVGHANALKDLMNDLPSMFPEGSDFGETDAKAEIWQNWDKFKLAAETASGKAQAFADAAASGDAAATGKAMKELGDTCKTCHKEYKAKR